MVATFEYIEQVLTTFAKATEANLSTPGREGNVVTLEPDLASEVMITGDVHGNRRNFNTIRKIAALDAHPLRHLVLQEVCHGGPTYPANGGCMSHTILEDVAALKARYPQRVHFILGNHELAELTDYPIQKNRQMLNLTFRLGLQQMYGPATDKVRRAYLRFIRSCPLAVRLPGGLFISHSLPERVDTKPFDKSIFTRDLELVEYFDQTAVFDLVWGRDYRQDNAQAFAAQVDAQVLICGHEPCSEGFSTPNSLQIILDCCGDKASFVLLPTNRSWTQAEIVERIQRLS